MKPENYNSEQASISGTIEFQGVGEPIHDATIYVRVEDVQRADAPAITVAERVLNNIDIVPSGAPLPFKVEGIPLSQNVRYVVRVHADADHDGKISRGDYISTQSYPVEPSGEEQRIAIVVRRVG